MRHYRRDTDMEIFLVSDAKRLDIIFTDYHFRSHTETQVRVGVEDEQLIGGAECFIAGNTSITSTIKLCNNVIFLWKDIVI